MSNDKFLADRMAELMAARERGDSKAAVSAFHSALSESEGTVTERLKQMTAAVENAKRKR